MELSREEVETCLHYVEHEDADKVTLPKYMAKSLCNMALAAAQARRDAERYLDAIFAMADDGWLYHGPEGMDATQELVYAIAQEHPEYKRRAALESGKSGGG